MCNILKESSWYDCVVLFRLSIYIYFGIFFHAMFLSVNNWSRMIFLFPFELTKNNMKFLIFWNYIQNGQSKYNVSEWIRYQWNCFEWVFDKIILKWPYAFVEFICDRSLIISQFRIDSFSVEDPWAVRIIIFDSTGNDKILFFCIFGCKNLKG